jgi:hypothetical protein
MCTPSTTGWPTQAFLADQADSPWAYAAVGSMVYHSPCQSWRRSGTAAVGGLDAQRRASRIKLGTDPQARAGTGRPDQLGDRTPRLPQCPLCGRRPRQAPWSGQPAASRFRRPATPPAAMAAAAAAGRVRGRPAAAWPPRCSGKRQTTQRTLARPASMRPRRQFLSTADTAAVSGSVDTRVPRWALRRWRPATAGFGTPATGTSSAPTLGSKLMGPVCSAAEAAP